MINIEDIIKNSIKKLNKKNKKVTLNELLCNIEQHLKLLDDLDRESIEYILNDIEQSKKIIYKIENNIAKLANSDQIETTILKNSNNNIIKQLQKNLETLFTKVDKLNEELHNDVLTGAYNRRWLFKEYLKHEMFTPENGVMIFIDLNKFKNINDTYGHIVGDKVLKYFVDFIKKELIHKGYDNDQFKIVRLAGDEFIIIINDELDIVKQIIKNIRKLLINIPFNVQNSDNTFIIDFSYGICPFKVNDKIEDIMKKADNSMYHFKAVRKSKRLD